MPRTPRVSTDVAAFSAELRALRQRLTVDWSAPGLRVTPPVVVAVDEALAELERPKVRWSVVATLLRAKSHLCGQEMPGEPFAEDAVHNESTGGASVYAVLDGLQFTAAMAADMLPAGMAVMYSDGSAAEERLDATVTDSPTVRLMAAIEHRDAERRSTMARRRRAEAGRPTGRPGGVS